MPSINFGTVNTAALAEYFIKRYNLVGRDASYMKNRPTLAMVPRDTEKLKQGNGFYETLKVAGGFSASPDWVEGNKNHNVSTKVQWAIQDPYAQYGYLAFDNLALNRNNTGTLLDIKGSEGDDVRDGMLDTTEFELWNDGTGSRGVAAAVSGTTTLIVTLATPSDVYNFSYGMVCTSNTLANGTGAAHTNRYKVSDLNPLAGQVTLTRTVDNTSPIAVADFIHCVLSAGAYMPGIPTFIPAADPLDVLYGVTRTGNPALSGWRFPFKASISETIGRAFSIMGRWVNYAAGKFVAVLSTSDWYLLSLEREGRIIPDPASVQKWGLSGLIVNTSFGPITCVAIPQLADGRGYLLDWTSWKLYTLKNVPHVIDEDGQTFVRGLSGTPDASLNGDFIKMQFRMWKILLCLKPMSNATFPTA
jgi:hypothetical protein